MLNKIINQQVIDIAKREQSFPLTHFAKDLTKSERDFYGALQKKRLAFIFECKHRSPSEGALRESYPFTQMAETYAQFADALSVLTNEPFFGGSFTHLKQVREAVDQPLLCKDIIINPYQVALARYYGADAVLLMLSVLDDEQYLACKAQAMALNMDVLTEIYSKEELQRAKNLEANIYVINHRDLNNFELDMNRIFSLLPDLPNNAFIIAASGINSHQQIQLLQDHVHGFLIGSALSKSPHVEKTMRELLFGNIKICGLTRITDAIQAYASGATLGGLIFAENSARKISLGTAYSIVSCAPLNYVGVFVQQPIPYIVELTQKLQLFAVQLHGGESVEYIASLRQALPPQCQIWFAIAGNHSLPEKLPSFVDKLVIDNITQDKPGGSGKFFDWKKIANHPLLQHSLLAGGIDLLNIQLAKKMGTWGLDINSGIELSPGIKDHAKIRKILS